MKEELAVDSGGDYSNAHGGIFFSGDAINARGYLGDAGPGVSFFVPHILDEDLEGVGHCGRYTGSAAHRDGSLHEKKWGDKSPR